MKSLLRGFSLAKIEKNCYEWKRIVDLAGENFTIQEISRIENKSLIEKQKRFRELIHLEISDCTKQVFTLKKPYKKLFKKC